MHIIIVDKCGQHQLCMDYKQCPTYLKTFKSLADIRQTKPEQFRNGMAGLRKKICETDLKKVCCEVPSSDIDIGDTRFPPHIFLRRQVLSDTFLFVLNIQVPFQALTL